MGFEMDLQRTKLAFQYSLLIIHMDATAKLEIITPSAQCIELTLLLVDAVLLVNIGQILGWATKARHFCHGRHLFHRIDTSALRSGTKTPHSA